MRAPRIITVILDHTHKDQAVLKQMWVRFPEEVADLLAEALGEPDSEWWEIEGVTTGLINRLGDPVDESE